MKITLQDLLTRHSFNVASLMNAEQFVKIAHSCGLVGTFSKPFLEFLEKERLFLPVARIMFEPVWYNAEKTEKRSWPGVQDDKGNNWKLVSRCKEDPNWAGEKIDVREQFSCDQRTLHILNDEGLIVDPREVEFTPWEEYKDDDFQKKGDCYYSIFQLYHLKRVLNGTRTGLTVSVLFNKEFDSFIERQKKDVLNSSENFRRLEPELHQRSLLLQLIADRYLPFAQTDQRTINYSTSNHEFNLSEYRRNWDAKEIAEQFSIDQEELRKAHDHIKRDAHHLDPISAWHELTVFIPWEQKKKLKGDALLAQYLYNNEHMLRMFHQDAFEEQLSAPHYENMTKVDYNHGVTDEKSALPYRPYIVNRYSLDTTPRLILLVEGQSEELFFPKIIEEIFGREMAQTGVHIWNVKGVDRFCGHSKAKEKPYERFIDFNQCINGTIVFSIFDDEGSVSKVFTQLKNKDSDFLPNAKITYEEYMHIWEQTLEFDNFTDAEIARALTECSENRWQCTDELVATARIEQRNSKKDTLSLLYKENLSYDLNKPRLNELLLQHYIADVLPHYEEEKDLRPFITVVQRFLNLARINIPPKYEGSKEQSIEYLFSNDEEIRKKRRERFLKEDTDE